MAELQRTADTTNTPPAEAVRPERVVTIRSLCAALVVSCLAAVLMCFHDGNIIGRNITSHNYMAPMSIGTLLVFVLLVNGTLSLVRRNWALRAGELGVVTALVLVTAPLPRYFAHNLVGTIGHTQSLIVNQQPTAKELSKTNIYLVLPDDAMLAIDHSNQYDGTLADQTGDLAPLSAIPWKAWVQPVLFWAPLMVVFLMMSVSLGYVLYRQWAHRELVPYPIAQITSDLVRNTRGRALPDIFYNHLFWMGVALMVFIFGCNGLAGHFPKMIKIPTGYSYYELSKTFPFLNFSQEGYSLLRGTLYFTIIALAVLLPSEISFTSWFTWPLMVTATYFYYAQTGERFQHHHTSMVNTGAWWAMAILIVYTGRTVYKALIVRCVGLKTSENLDSGSVWMFRIFAVSALSFIGIVVSMGIPLDIAILYLIATIVFFIVVSRLVTEMGIIWTPVSGGGASAMGFLLLTMGAKALGVKVYALLAIITSLVLPNNVSTLSLVPAVGNAAATEHRITGRNDSVRYLIPFMLIVLVFSCGILIWLGYSFEGNLHDIHAKFGLNQVNAAAKQIGTMTSEGRSARMTNEQFREVLSVDQTFSERWAMVETARNFGGFFAVGFMLVIGTGLLRLKFPRFPLHPLPLVLFGSWLMSRYWFSFLIGWLIKKAILKIGGGKLFEKSRPFFTGVIAGQIIVVIATVVVDIFLFYHSNFEFKMEWWIFISGIYSS